MLSTASWCWWIKTLVLDLKNSQGYRSEKKSAGFDTWKRWCFSFLTNLASVFVCKMDMVTSMKALNKTVEASQLTSDLGGTFIYNHTDWLQFHQVLIIHPVFPNATAEVLHHTSTLNNCGVSLSQGTSLYPHTHSKHSSPLLFFNATFSLAFESGEDTDTGESHIWMMKQIMHHRINYWPLREFMLLLSFGQPEPAEVCHEQLLL